MRDFRTPNEGNIEIGAKIVGHAWADPVFKERLLRNPSAVLAEFGVKLWHYQNIVPEPAEVVFVENTETVHNVVVCTFCHCYPRMVIGPPPEWYDSAAYRYRINQEPREVLKEFGLVIPESIQIRVHDSVKKRRYMVLPRRPRGTEGWFPHELAKLVTRDSLLGVGEPR